MSFELPLPLYKTIQIFANGDYSAQKSAIGEFLQRHFDLTKHKPSVLELACGAGNLASHFPADDYLGVDSAPDRIAAACASNPTHAFQCLNVHAASARDVIRRRDFFFCHALLHHLSDSEIACLLALVKDYARKPASILAIEPLLPSFFDNPAGYCLGKLDRGRYVRRKEDYMIAFGGNPNSYHMIPKRPCWPQEGGVFWYVFD